MCIVEGVLCRRSCFAISLAIHWAFVCCWFTVRLRSAEAEHEVFHDWCCSYLSLCALWKFARAYTCTIRIPYQISFRSIVVVLNNLRRHKGWAGTKDVADGRSKRSRDGRKEGSRVQHKFPAPLLKRPVQEPTDKKVTKERKECQEVKICKASKVAPADSKVTNDSSSFQLQKEPFEELGKKRKENWQEIRSRRLPKLLLWTNWQNAFFRWRSQMPAGVVQN